MTDGRVVIRNPSVVKEKYFDSSAEGERSSTIETQSQSFLHEIEPLRNRRKIHFDSYHSALLILDMQKFFLESSSHAFVPSAPAIVPNILKLKDLFSKNQAPIIVTRHVNSSENAGKMEVWWRDLLTEENPGSNLIEEFREIDKAIMIEKTQYDAFFSTDLDQILKSLKVSQVIVTGVLTHLCCETTARSAFMRGFDVFFGIDSTATFNRFFHESTLRNLSHGFGIPFLTRELFSPAWSLIDEA